MLRDSKDEYNQNQNYNYKLYITTLQAFWFYNYKLYITTLQANSSQVVSRVQAVAQRKQNYFTQFKTIGG